MQAAADEYFMNRRPKKEPRTCVRGNQELSATSKRRCCYGYHKSRVNRQHPNATRRCIHDENPPFRVHVTRRLCQWPGDPANRGQRRCCSKYRKDANGVCVPFQGNQQQQQQPQQRTPSLGSSLNSDDLHLFENVVGSTPSPSSRRSSTTLSRRKTSSRKLTPGTPRTPKLHSDDFENEDFLNEIFANFTPPSPPRGTPPNRKRILPVSPGRGKKVPRKSSSPPSPPRTTTYR